MTKTIEWDPGLHTGDVTIDEQHRQLVELFNDLVSADTDRTPVLPILERIDALAFSHFLAEENLMVRVGYPTEPTRKHVSLHVDLKNQVRDKVLAFKAGELVSTAPLAVFLREWLITHEIDMDRELVVFVKGHTNT